MSKTGKYVGYPVVMGVCVALGMILGTILSGNSIRKNGLYVNKLEALLSLINDKYVDTVDQSKIIEDLIPKVLDELDPHSVYLPAKDRLAANETIEGRFSGVGIQFNVVDDTVRVVSVVHGGPSEKAGVLAGDRIIRINGKIFTGKKINTDNILKTLRGDKGSPVKVTVLRNKTNKILNFTIYRDDIPLYSVDAKYRIGRDVGYIKISNFGRNSHAEFMDAMTYLQRQKCSRFVIDLRGNPGGLMEPALEIANEFLPANRLILYTQGKNYPREEVRSNGKGSFQNVPLVILTDEISASSSEILTGAIQDNDRGFVVGRRSFGKGLVQNEIPFRDGSAVRLTIARFYIPSGRCIQKPYSNGSDKNYQNDLYNRYVKGEFENLDSIKINKKLHYKTVAGRTVYGGGGIIPDFFVPYDTTGLTTWFNRVAGRGLINAFAFRYADAHRDTLAHYNTANKLSSYLEDVDLVTPFISYAEQHGIYGAPAVSSPSYILVRSQIKAFIARNVLNEDAFWKLLQEDDVTLTKAVEIVMKSRGGSVAGKQ